MIEEELESLVTFLGRHHLSSDHEGCSGLLIRENGSAITADALHNMLQEHISVDLQQYNARTDDTKCCELMWHALSQGSWVMLHIARSPAAQLIAQLELINTAHRMRPPTTFNYPGAEHLIPRESSLVVFADRELIEKEVNYRTFYSLFGPVVSV